MFGIVLHGPLRTNWLTKPNGTSELKHKLVVLFSLFLFGLFLFSFGMLHMIFKDVGITKTYMYRFGKKRTPPTTTLPISIYFWIASPVSSNRTYLIFPFSKWNLEFSELNGNSVNLKHMCVRRMIYFDFLKRIEKQWRSRDEKGWTSEYLFIWMNWLCQRDLWFKPNTNTITKFPKILWHLTLEHR